MIFPALPVPLLSFTLIWLLDARFGDPTAFWHPVRIMGHAVSAGEKLVRQLPLSEGAAGRLLVAVLVPGAFCFLSLLLHIADAVHPVFSFLIQIWFGWLFLARRDLSDAAMEVYAPLASGDLPAARRSLAMIVGRDVSAATETEAARAAAETVAENLVDGVLAPLFFAALGGIPLMGAYKMINTLDSMIGYKNQRYLHFGRAAARLDDLANWIPARISLALIPMAAVFGPDGFSTARRALRIGWRDRRRHSSPNSGHPEAAFSGALGVRFGGAAAYHGKTVEKPVIGGEFPEAEARHIPLARDLMHRSALIGMGLAILLSFGVRLMPLP